jgi:putative FmdB family regulatory protein
MPLYEYVCRSCRHGFETLVLGSDDVPACPRCGTTDLERLLSAAAIGRGVRDVSAAAPAPGGCGRCGDPRGPGACAVD